MEFFVWLLAIVIIGIGIKSAWNFLQDLFGFLGFSSGTSKCLERSEIIKHFIEDCYDLEEARILLQREYLDLLNNE